MKRNIASLLCLIIAASLLFSGCGDKSGSTLTEITTSDSVTVTENGTSSLELADTSGMDFSVDDIESKTEVASGTVVDLTKDSSKTSTNSGVESYSITSGGTYTFTGTKKDVMISVDADENDVTLVLKGVTINNSKAPAIYIKSAKNVEINLAKGTSNTLTDGTSYSITDGDSALDAAVFSRADLTIGGEGTLNVNGNYKHGIVSKDDLIISSGTYNVTANNVALNGKDCVKIKNGNLTLKAGSDGIRSDNTEDTQKGYIYLNGGTLNINAENDGIQAETVVKIENVNLTVTAGGGSVTSLSSSSESYKGIKAGSDIYISGGIFNINSKDDCIHSNGTITISGGTYTLSSGDDGVHADTDLAVSGDKTKLTINKSYEGLEATSLIISGGDISITASDDGLNAAGGNDSSGMGGRFGMGGFSSSNGKIEISGGKIHISMSGDGIDANGTLSITGGDITVSGANQGDTAILDFDSTGDINGGTFIGTGASGMSQNFSSSSTQGVIMVMVGSQSKGTTVKLTDSSGKTLLSRTTDRDYSCVILSCASIKSGGTYTLTAGSYSEEITMSSTVYGSSGSGMGGGGFGGGGHGGFGGGMGGRW